MTWNGPSAIPGGLYATDRSRQSPEWEFASWVEAGMSSMAKTPPGRSTPRSLGPDVAPKQVKVAPRLLHVSGNLLPQCLYRRKLDFIP